MPSVLTPWLMVVTSTRWLKHFPRYNEDLLHHWLAVNWIRSSRQAVQKQMRCDDKCFLTWKKRTDGFWDPQGRTSNIRVCLNVLIDPVRFSGWYPWHENSEYAVTPRVRKDNYLQGKSKDDLLPCDTKLKWTADPVVESTHHPQHSILINANCLCVLQLWDNTFSRQ